MIRAFLLFLCVHIAAHSEEVFDASQELNMLRNIRQVTFAEMGFEKAGEAYFSPDGQTIIFQAVPAGKDQYQIYTMNLDEGIPHMVSTGKGACTCAYFRPDGKKILFASSHEDPELDMPDFSQEVPGYKRQGGSYSWAFTPYMNIYEANPDGSNLIALTHGPHYHAECAYSHDGNKIVFASNESGTMNLYTMNAARNAARNVDDSDVFAVTKTTYSYNGGPFFSPDDSLIVFRSDRQEPNMLQIYSIKADGTDEQQLTDNAAVNWAPYWHPNGKVIAYTTSLHGHAHYEIYLLNVETKVQHRLTHNKAFDGLPVFSPCGTKLLWTSKRGINASQIFIADFSMPVELE